MLLYVDGSLTTVRSNYRVLATNALRKMITEPKAFKMHVGSKTGYSYLSLDESPNLPGTLEIFPLK